MRTVAQYRSKRTGELWTLIREGRRLMCIWHPGLHAGGQEVSRLLWSRTEYAVADLDLPEFAPGSLRLAF